MKITRSERGILFGPTFVGILVGAFAAFCVVAFDSDYGGTIQVWPTIFRAMLGFFGGFLLAFLPFGLLPVLVTRLMRRNRSGELIDLLSGDAELPFRAERCLS